MRVCIDIETNSLHNPDKIWLIVCKDIDTGEFHIFREVTNDSDVAKAFLLFSKSVNLWIGHNILGYDYPVLNNLMGLIIPDIASVCVDTLIVSKLYNYSREGGHSIERFGKEFSEDLEQTEGNLEKLKFNDWTKYSQEMEDYCVRDVEICHRVYTGFNHICNDPAWHSSILLEQRFQSVVNNLHDNGFAFDTAKASLLLGTISQELNRLDEQILTAFPPKAKPIKEYTPKETKYGTISKSTIPRGSGPDLSAFTVGASFVTFSYVPFNPNSHKQVVEVLNTAGWRPIDKTTTHIETERTINRLKYHKNRSTEVDIRLKECYDDLKTMGIYGWKVNENNLSTLPGDAPEPAKKLSKRILLESRRRTLTEWLGLVEADGRIHGQFYGIGAWTHRMAHQRPNTANIPTNHKLFGEEMRSLWRSPEDKVLVGVDAKGIQLRIFAHYVDDPEFTKEVTDGDPHSLNQRVIGQLCQSRDAAKRFIFALLLGAGIGKLSEILGVSRKEGQQALDRILRRYQGLSFLRENTIPNDARRGYFIGLDGRKVLIPGQTQGERQHLCMSGYLQNGEAIIMKRACLKWEQLPQIKLVNFVHDEWQIEVIKEMAEQVAKLIADSLRRVGEELKLRCPLAGSYKIGQNWSMTH